MLSALWWARLSTGRCTNVPFLFRSVYTLQPAVQPVVQPVVQPAVKRKHRVTLLNEAVRCRVVAGLQCMCAWLLTYRGWEGCLPAGSQLQRHGEMSCYAQGQGRNWVGHQGSEQRPGSIYWFLFDLGLISRRTSLHYTLANCHSGSHREFLQISRRTTTNTSRSNVHP